jgi:AcrR family transcriptional regulator
VSAPTRERIVLASAELFRRQGYVGTGVKQIVSEAKAPFGSLYHFFPGGKEQLGSEVIRTSGAMYGLLLPAIFENAPDLITGTEQFFALAAQHLRESDYEDACPIATVALEVSSSSEPLREACAEVFNDWISAGTERLASYGLSPESARELVSSILCLLEGAFIFARAMRSPEPLEVAGRAAVALAEEALLRSETPRGGRNG